MRKLVLLPLLVFSLACNDNTPVEPELALSLELGVGQAAGGQGEAVKMVPYKGKGTWWGLNGDVVEREGFDCDALGGYLDQGAGVINVTHLGRSDYSFINCWDGTLETILYQTGTVTAANGDQLFWDGPGDGDWDVFVVDWAGGSYQMGPLIFSGGTGRFAGATGSFVSFGTFVEIDGGYGGTEMWEGTISSVGSSK